MTVLVNSNPSSKVMVNGEVESFSDPEDFKDDIDDDDLVGDLKAKRPTENDTSDCVLIIDGIPMIGPDRLPKLKGVMTKLFSKLGRIESEHYPLDEEENTKGYCFMELADKSMAEATVQLLDGHRLDKTHTLMVNLFTDLDKYRHVQEKWERPKVKPYKDPGNLKFWLLDRQCRDQFLVQYEGGEKVVIFLNNTTGDPVQLQEKSRWTETTCRWSPRGTYLSTFHSQGVALWGGEAFEQIVKFPHPDVTHVDFSPCEKYLVTYAEPKQRYGETADALRIWEIFTGELKRGFPLSQNDIHKNNMTWPYFRWSHDDKYFAVLRDESIVLYDTQTFKIKDKKLGKHERVKDFQWSEKGNIIAYYLAEKDQQIPGVVGLMNVGDEDREPQNKNLFNVSDAKVYWQKGGNYVCVKVDRYAKKKWDEKESEWKYSGINQNLEVFFVNEKAVPNSFIEITDNVRDFAWDPYGAKFCVIHGDMKCLASFYSVRDSKITLIKEFEPKQSLNKVIWAPSGTYCVLTGLKISGSGTLIFVDTSGNDANIMNTQEHTGLTAASWDPTGRYLTSSVSLWEQGKGDYGYMMWNFQGQLKDKRSMPHFCYLSWRPRPPSVLPDDKIKEVKRNMKKYVALFEERDRQMLSKTSKEILEKRKSQVEEYRQWREEKRKVYASELAERMALRDNMDTDDKAATDFAEERFEYLIEENIEVIETNEE